MKAYITKRYTFPASHRLHCEDLSDAENEAIYGKCSRPHGHGHNYAVEITIGGPVDARTGMVCDLAELDAIVSDQILAVFDHANLNTLPAFQTRVPTTENLCLAIFAILRKQFHTATVEQVRIEETRKNSFACGNVRP